MPGRVLAPHRGLAKAAASAAPAEFAFRRVLEARLSPAGLAVPSGQCLRLQFSLWKDGLPVYALPQEGWLEISTAEPTAWPV